MSPAALQKPIIIHINSKPKNTFLLSNASNLAIKFIASMKKSLVYGRMELIHCK